MEIDIGNLIKVVKKHRMLYDTSVKEYYDRVKKRNVWKEVCALLSSSWDTFDDAEKAVYYKEVQKKWESLRDCFRREFALQRNMSKAGKKKAKYKYFDALQFLTPFTQSALFAGSNDIDDVESITDPETSSSSKDPLSEDTEPIRKRRLSTVRAKKTAVSQEEIPGHISNISGRFKNDSQEEIPEHSSNINRRFIDESQEEIPEHSSNINSRFIDESQQEIPEHSSNITNRFIDDSQEEVPDHSGNISSRYIDDDEAFLFSLLPGFKEYSLEQKYLLRIEIMKTILKFKQSQNNINVLKVEVDEEFNYI